MEDMFDKTKLAVRFTGTEYLEYRKWRKDNRIKLTYKQKQGIIWIAGSLLFALLMGIFWQTFFPVEHGPSLLSSYWRAALDNKLFTASWEGVLKFLLIMTTPFLLVGIVIGWIIHGVGFYIVRR